MGQNNNIPRVQLTIPWLLPLPIGVGEAGDGSLPGTPNQLYATSGLGSPNVTFDPNQKAGTFFEIDVVGWAESPSNDTLSVSCWLCRRGAVPSTGTLLWQATPSSDGGNEPFVFNLKVTSCGAGNFTAFGFFNWRNIIADFGDTTFPGTIAAANANEQLILVPTFQWATNTNGNLITWTCASAKKYTQFDL